jgi:hypothetical protein
VASRRPRRRRTFEEWVNSPKVTGWFLVVVSGVCLVFAVVTYQDAVALRDRGLVAEAQVIEVHDGRDSSVVLRFQTADGHAVTADVGNYYWRPKPRVGDRQTVLYDPDQPEDNVADTRLGPDFSATWFLSVGGGIAATLTWPTITGRIDWMRFRR